MYFLFSHAPFTQSENLVASPYVQFYIFCFRSFRSTVVIDRVLTPACKVLFFIRLFYIDRFTFEGFVCLLEFLLYLIMVFENR